MKLTPEEFLNRFPIEVQADEKGVISRIRFVLQAPVTPIALEVVAFVLGENETMPNYALDVPVFQGKVLTRCAEIQKGETMTYAQLAEELGGKSFVRAVGQGLSRNPLPLLIPCHRVVGDDFQLRGYQGGLELKDWLLRVEGVNLPGRQQVLQWN